MKKRRISKKYATKIALSKRAQLGEVFAQVLNDIARAQVIFSGRTQKRESIACFNSRGFTVYAI
jgi:hypothetical protein